MEKLLPADIVFVMHHDSKISRIIAWFMGSKWSHTALIFDSSGRHEMTTETNSFCVKHGTMTVYRRDPNCSFEVWRKKRLSHGQRQLIADRSIDLVDTPYGWPQLFSFGVRRLLRKIGIKIPNFFRFGMVCDHVGLYCYRDFASEFPADPESIDTEELYQIVLGAPDFQLIDGVTRCQNTK